MTQPVVPTPPAAPTTTISKGGAEVSPFTDAAIKQAVPAKRAPVVETPVADANAAAGGVEAPPSAGTTPPVAGQPTTLAEKVKAAEDAAARIVARRQATAKNQNQTQQVADYYKQENARLAQEAATAKAVAERIDKDFMGVAREKGIPAKVVAQAAIDDSTPEGRIAKLEREIQERNQRDQEAARQQQIQQANKDLVAQNRAYVHQVSNTKESNAPDAPLMYPWLAARAKVNPALVAAEARQILEFELARQAREVPPHLRRVPTNKDIADYQEWCYIEAEKARLSAGAPPAPVTGGTPPLAPAGAVSGAKPPMQKGATTTLSSKILPTTAGVPKPYGQMTKEERLAHDAALLKKLTPATE